MDYNSLNEMVEHIGNSSSKEENFQENTPDINDKNTGNEECIEGSDISEEYFMDVKDGEYSKDHLVYEKNDNKDIELDNCNPRNLLKPVYTNSICVMINNVYNLKDEFQSPLKYISGIPWKLVIKRVRPHSDKRNGECIAIYVKCCSSEKNFKISANSQIILYSHEANKPNVIKKTSHLYTEEKNLCGYNQFISMVALYVNESKYVWNDKIYVEAIIDVNKRLPDKEIEEKVKKFLDAVDESIKINKLSDARDICVHAINCFGQAYPNFASSFKKRLQDITNAQLNETIQRIEKRDLNVVTKPEKVLKKESDLKKLCQENKHGKNNKKNNTLKNDSSNTCKKPGEKPNSESSNKQQKKQNDYKVEKKLKIKDKLCECKLKHPDMIFFCKNCHDSYESKSFLFTCKIDTFYYIIYGSRSYINGIFKGMPYAYNKVLNEKLKPIEKCFIDTPLFDTIMNDSAIDKLSTLNKGVGRFVFNMHKSGSNLKNFIVCILDACERSDTIKPGNLEKIIPSIEEHFDSVEIFNNISPYHLAQFSVGKVIEYIQQNALSSLKIFEKFSMKNELTKHGTLLSSIKDPNLKEIFKNDHNYICVFPTMWLTIMSQTIDMWLILNDKFDIFKLSNKVDESIAFNKTLVNKIRSIEDKLAKKTATINELNKKFEQHLKQPKKPEVCNNKVLELEKMIEELKEQNENLKNQKKQLSEELGSVKGQCRNAERINGEKDAKYKALQKSFKLEKADLENEIKILKNRCKKYELSCLEKAYNNDMKDLQKAKSFGLKKLDEWNALSGDIYERNLDIINQNKDIITEYLNDISEQIDLATSNYNKNISLLEDGKLISQIGKIRIKNIKQCPVTTYEHFLNLSNLEGTDCDTLSFSSKLNIKKRGSIKNFSKNKFITKSPSKFDDLSSTNSDTKSKTSYQFNDIFSNVGYFDKNELKNISNNNDYESVRSFNTFNDYDRRDCNFNDYLSSPSTDNGSKQEYNSYEIIPPYNNTLKYEYSDKMDSSSMYIKPHMTNFQDVHMYNSNANSIKHIPTGITSNSTSFMGYNYSLNENSSFRNSYKSSLSNQSSEIFSNMLSMDSSSQQPYHSFNNKSIHTDSHSNQLSFLNRENVSSELPQENYSALLKAFHPLSSSDNIW
uniref:MATH domain-containing protein n=1 Tax=Parastrongyloides trichosuri TaxID=131310 RepID=A0A0N4ZYQ7_PARTI